MKKVFKILPIIIGLLVLSAPQTARAVVLKIGTLSPAGSAWMKKMEAGAAEVEKRTEGRVKFKFYPGGVMGDEPVLLQKMRIGQLQGGALLGGTLCEAYSDSRVYSLPLLFKSFEEVDYVRKQMDQVLIDGFKKGGFVAFGIADGGFAYVMSKAPVRTLDEMRRQKLWIPSNDKTSLAAVQAFGISPIPLAISDVLAGLQTGMIDAVGVSPIGAIALQWHTQVKYMTDLPLIYLFGVFVVTEKAFDRIKPEDQKVLKEVMGRVFAEINQYNRRNNVEAIEALSKQGVQILKPDEAALQEWRRLADKTPDSLIASGELSREMFEKVKKLLSDYRAQNP